MTLPPRIVSLISFPGGAVRRIYRTADAPDGGTGQGDDVRAAQRR
ncbi:hypothetical protein ACIBRY_26150 [Streptomyces anulatus]